jgi:hypothetical protein
MLTANGEKEFTVKKGDTSTQVSKVWKVFNGGLVTNTICVKEGKLVKNEQGDELVTEVIKLHTEGGFEGRMEVFESKFTETLEVWLSVTTKNDDKIYRKITIR